MKKILSLALAFALVASMAAVAFAAASYGIKIDAAQVKPVFSTAFAWNSSKSIMEVNSGNSFAYGETAYYALMGTDVATKADKALVYEYDAVKGLKLKPTWSMGGSLVEKVEVVKKKIATDDFVALSLTNAGKPLVKDADYSSSTNEKMSVIYSGARQYAYFLAVSIKDSTSTAEQFVSGKIAFAKSTGKDADDKLAYDVNSFDVNIDVKFKAVADASSNTVKEDKQVFFSNNGEKVEDYELVLIGDDIAVFTVDARGQGKLTISANNKFDSAIAAKYDANMNFLKTNGVSFNRTGELKIYAEEGSYLYEIKADGTLVKSRATYNEYEEAFILKTRTLGSYIIADEELNVAGAGEEIEVVEPGTEPPVAAPNPGTGAAA